MANRIQLRRDTAANWTRVNPVLEDGEPGLEIDTNYVKYGDGNTPWVELAYASTGGGGSVLFDYSTVQEGTVGFSNVTSITGNTNTGVSLTSDEWAQLMWVPDTDNITIANIVNGPATYNWAYVDDSGFIVESNVSSVRSTWKFHANSLLTTPGNVQVGNVGSYGSISFVDTISANNYVYANGVSILTGISGNTGSVTFDSIKIIGANVGNGNGDIEIVPDNTGTYYADGQYIRIYPTRAIPDAPHIHIASGYGGDLILGDDYTGVDINHDSNVYIRTNGTVYNWRFDNDGSTTFPDHQPVTITGNLTVGNLIVTGNSSVINTESYVVADNIIQMANANPADTLDLGFVAHRTVDSTLEHTGLVRDASTGSWKLFSNIIAQPGTTVDFTDAVYDSLNIGGLTAGNTNLYSINFTGSPIASSSPGIQWYNGFQSEMYGNVQVERYLGANVGAYQTWANTQIQTLNANLGTLFLGNASTNANLGAYQTWANSYFGTSSYGNTQVTAYLLTWPTANIGTLNGTSGNITTLTAANFSTANAVITGGYVTGLANVTVTGNVTVGNLIGSSANTTITAGAYTTSFLSNGLVTTSNITVGNLTISSGATEQFGSVSGPTSTQAYDAAANHLFYNTSPTVNWTANFTNLILAPGQTTNLSLIIVQGGTGYYPSAVQIGGVGQTIKWLGNVTPVPAANAVEMATFTILNVGGTYTVLGSYSTFGG